MKTKPTFLTAREVRARYGGISDMSLWRWLRDTELNFPQPMVIRRRRLWQDDKLDAFDARQRQEA
ncbi:DNA-binding protein [Mesorhizobium sp. ASY16-5R]|uniref:DNA-binding protein n=1 Tax=Mesorhizobium sp. ASY16-5R TaxID=3445772 RepID=UPI003FA11AB8